MGAVLIESDWPRHPRVRAAYTTRSGGVSRAPYDTFNLAHHVADATADVIENRRRLREALALTDEPAWLDQVHGTRVARAENLSPPECADASWTDRPGAACVILSADCLPVLFADDSGSCVAAAHAGWRGLAAGVLEATVAAMPVPPDRLSAWLGPAIGPSAFEVGDEVRAAFLAHPTIPAQTFVRNERGRWSCDLYAIARARLSTLGLTRIHGGGLCTFSDRGEFFSYRRDGRCGRMASLVWIT